MTIGNTRGAVFLVWMLGLVSACRSDRPRPVDLVNAIAAAPESGSPGAVSQRYKFRRQLLDSMRADLARLVVAESLYFADSGKYSATTSCPGAPGTAHWCASTGDNLDYPRITAHGWHVTITNLNLSAVCAVQVGNDTTYGAPSGEPICFGSHPGQPRAF